MMFLNPAWLWLFAALPVIAAIYLLKVRPKLKVTTTMFLWDKIFLEKKSSALFRKLKDILSLLLILIAMSLVILALSKPVFSSSIKERLLIIVIDNSVGMNVRDNKRALLESAKNAAEKIINKAGAGQSMVIASISDELKIIVGSTENKRRLLNGVKSLEPSFFPLNTDAFSSLGDISKQFKDSRLIIISDCSFPAKPPKGAFLVKVGGKSENAGISALDMMYAPDAKNLKIYCQISSSFAENRKCDLVISFDSEENIRKVYPLAIKPGVNKPVVIEIKNAEPEKWVIALDIKDSLDADNKAYAVVPPPKLFKVSLGAEDARPFYRFFVDSFKQSNKGFKLIHNNEKADIAILEGSEKKSPAAESYIIFNPSGDSMFWKKIQPLENASTVPQKILPEHPSVKFCNLDNVDFSGAKKIVPPDNSVVIVKSIDGIPLIYKTEVSGRKAYVLNLNPVDSDFFLNVSFPVILRSMALDLSGVSKEAKAAYSSSELSRMKNRLENANGEFSGKPGFYKSGNAKDKNVYACSILSESESLSRKIEPGKSALKIKAGMPLSDLFYILAAIILTVECILYHRRKVG